MKGILLGCVMLASSVVEGQASVSGSVRDSSGRALPGVEVVVDSPSVRGFTDEAGHYSIRNVPAGERMLRARLLGYYSTADVAVIAGSKPVTLDFVLRRNPTMLDTMRVADRSDTRDERSNRNVIKAETMQEGHFETAYDALEALRPTWLSIRGPTSFGTSDKVWVYIDNVKAGGVEILKTTPVRLLLTVTHLDGVTANARYGIGHGAGVILVETIGK